MYVGKKYTATRTNEFDMEFRCVRCGFTAECSVVGVGMGQGNSAYFTDNEGAAERAASRATEDASKNAELTLKLCPCPKCGARDSTGFIAQSALALVGSTAFSWGLGWFIASLKGGKDDAAFWIFGLMGLILPVILFYTTIQWKWTTAEQRVAFKEPEGEEPKKRAKQARKRAAPEA
jgi:predicted RNA-binding Zn-ribbon protein involved in translation (DUF1610 family)